jgi:O-antigen/teichoic acid export membrane protein
MSSVTNFAANIYIAHELGAAAYGAFALAYVTYHFALNASRGLSTDPFVVRFSGTDQPIWRREAASATGTAAVTGLVTGAIVLAVTPLLGGSIQLAFLALGLTLPGLLLQDSWRYVFFAHGRGVLAFLNDTVWAVGLLAGLALLRVTGHDTLFWVVFVWGAAAALGAALGPLQAHVVPKLRMTRRWLAAHWDLAPRYLAEGTLNSAASQLVTYGIGLLLGLAALGAVQAASVLIGPYTVLIWGFGLVLMPEAVRIQRTSLRRLRLLCLLTGGAFAALAGVWGISLLVLLPMGLGQTLLGSLWHDAYPLVLPTTLYLIASAAFGAAGLGLRALGAARQSLKATIIATAAYVVGSLTGAVVAGAVGAVSGGAVGVLIGALACWWELQRALREAQAVQSEPAPESAPEPISWISWRAVPAREGSTDRPDSMVAAATLS